MVRQLILMRASVTRSSGQWSDDDYDVLENGKVVGRIFFLDAVGPQGRTWRWASGHNGGIKRAAHGYEPTRRRGWRRSRRAGRKGGQATRLRAACLICDSALQLLAFDGKSAERRVLFANFQRRLVVCAVVPSL